jgi:hypothetical protein
MSRKQRGKQPECRTEPQVKLEYRLNPNIDETEIAEGDTKFANSVETNQQK